MPEQTAPKTMDPTQLHKMNEVLGADLRNIKERLDQERREKEELLAKTKEREEEFARMQKHLNMVKEEKKQYYSGMIDNKVKPFLEDLRKQSENDTRMSDSINIFQTQLDQGLDNAFMDPSQLATLQVAVAASAANQVTSSKLEELFQSQKQWEEKFSALQKEKEELEAVSSTTRKAMEETNSTKEKMVEDLKKELAELKAKHEKSINNVEGHFAAADAPTDSSSSAPTDVPAAAAAPAAQQTVAATASSSDKSFYGGFNTLFDFTPRESWRSANAK